MTDTDYINGSTIVWCNECGNDKTIATTDFRYFIDTIKSEGWVIKYVDEEWTQICPNCNDYEKT